MTFPGLDLFPGLDVFPGGDVERVGPTLLTVDGRDFGVDDGETLLVFDTLTGWYGGPGSRSNFVDRPAAHGSFDGDVYRASRVVNVAGWAYSNTRANVMAAIRDVTGCLAEGQIGDVVVDDPDDGKLTIAARLTDGPLVAWDAFDFCWTWQFSVTAPDPRKYAASVSAVARLASAGSAGLVFPLFDGTGVLDFGPPTSTGQATLTNSGTADTTSLYTVNGPVLGGFVITEQSTGDRNVYVDDVPAGAVLVIDPATGTAELNGADRSDQLTLSQGGLIKAGRSSTVVFSALGSPAQSGFLTASIRPAYW